MAPRTTFTVSQLSRYILRGSRNCPHSRSFTASLRRDGYSPLPVFEPSSSPEINSLLAVLRKTIFIPSRLPKVQRDMVFKASRHAQLKSNPVILQDGEEDVVVQPVKWDEVPRVRTTLISIIDLAKEPSDFRIIPKILEEFMHAGQKYPASIAAKIARKANTMGLQEVTIHCARAAKRTGFSLGNAEVANEAILGAHLVAQQAGWTKESLDLALKNASDIARMLEEPVHSWKDKPYPHHILPKPAIVQVSAQPYFIGVLLELLAIDTVKFQSGRDVEGRLSDCVDKFNATWSNYAFDWPVKDSQLFHHGFTLMRWLPTWNGIKAALKVEGLSKTQAKTLREHLAFIDKVVSDSREHILARRKESGELVETRAIDTYNELAKLRI